MRATDFDKIRVLSLVYCDGVTQFLSSLARLFGQNGSRLEGFSWHTMSERDMDGKCISRFLTSFTGLKHLDLHSEHPFDNFNVISIASYSATLDALFIYLGCNRDIYDTRSIMSLEQIKRICSTCKALRQLALAFPAHPLNASNVSPGVEYRERLVTSLALDHP